MIKDNQLSTILILLSMAVLIYYLTKPTQKENFEENNNLSESVFNGNNFNKIVFDENDENVFNENNFNKIVFDENNENVFNENNEELVQEKKESSRFDLSGVHDFEGEEQSYGASLDNAFDLPLNKDERPDEVDINRNNVKKYDLKQFLPNELDEEWFGTDWSMAQGELNDQTLINPSKFIPGTDTVGQSLKNPSYDIRGTIANPKYTVSPWNNSTYEPDYNIKSLC
jgi:hypothetical protein